MKIITADEACADAKQNEAVLKKHNVTVITPPDKKVKVPENVDEKSSFVYMNEYCGIPMDYIWSGRDKGHECKYGGHNKECLLFHTCPKYREIPLDAGLLG